MTWASREDLEAAVVEYQRNWWRTDDAALEVIDNRTSHPALRPHVNATSALGQVVTTADIYRPYSPGAPGNRPYLDERADVHERIIENCVPSILDPTPTAPPAAFFTIGCPGAGKTSVLRNTVERFRQRGHDTSTPHRASIVDADRVRQSLPEYSGGLGAFVVEPECYDITYGPLFDRAVARRGDIIYDTIGRLTSIRDYLDILRTGGYAIHVLHASSPLDLRRERTEQRALRVDGRLVDPAMLERAANAAAEVIGALLGEDFPLAGWADIDTNDMDNPALINGAEVWKGLL